MKNPFSTQAKVRDALATAGREMGIPEIRDIIGLSGSGGYARVNRAMNDLMKAKQVERCGRGLYRYQKDRPGSDYCAKQRRMQRIMWLRSKRGESFTVRHIAEVAECALYTAQRYIAFLAGKGVIRKAGQTYTTTTPAPLYSGEDDYLNDDAWPVMRAQSKTRELDALLNEMRDLAQRFFAVDNFTEETLLNLQNTVSGLAALVEECGKLKHSSSQNQTSPPLTGGDNGEGER